MRQRRKHSDKRPRETCYICKIIGLVGHELIATGSGKWVHQGKCHQDLIDKARKNMDSNAASTIGDRSTTIESTFRNLSDPPLFKDFTS